MKKILYIIGICFAVISCERRELTYDYYPYCDFDVTIDWSVFEGRTEYPKGASVWFYPQNGGTPTVSTANISPSSANSVSTISASLREGVYDVIVHNYTISDYSSINFRGTDLFSTYEIYGADETTTSSTWYSRSDDERVIRQPADFASITYESFEVTKEMVDATYEARKSATKSGSTTRSSLSLTPTMTTYDATIRINVVGIQNLSSARGVISGAAEGRVVSEDNPTAVRSTHVLESYTTIGSYGEGELIFTYSCFGLYSDEDGDTSYDHWEGNLYLEILLIDNKTIKSFDIDLDSSAIVDIDTGTTTIYIDIDNYLDDNGEEQEVELPDVEPADPSDGGGFSADVEEWGDEVGVELPV